MSDLTPDERALRAQIAAHTRWGRTADRTAATQPARDGLRAKYAREIDPDGTMPADEVERRIDHMVKAHMLRMSMAAKKARRAKKANGGGTDAA